jgi:hypothetical protein
VLVPYSQTPVESSPEAEQEKINRGCLVQINRIFGSKKIFIIIRFLFFSESKGCPSTGWRRCWVRTWSSPGRVYYAVRSCSPLFFFFIAFYEAPPTTCTPDVRIDIFAFTIMCSIYIIFSCFAVTRQNALLG